MFSFLKKKEKSSSLNAFLSGKVIPIEEVEDKVFSSKMMGDGLAILPTDEIVTAPADGVISAVMTDSKHAVGLRLDNGMDLLIHIGLDTVTMKGEGFHLFVKEGDKVKLGDKLINFDSKLIRKKGFNTVTIMVVTNSDQYPKLSFNTGIDAEAKETVIARY